MASADGLRGSAATLSIEASAIAGERAVGADDPMAGHQNGNGIAAVRKSHGARGVRDCPDALGELAVAQRFAERMSVRCCQTRR